MRYKQAVPACFAMLTAITLAVVFIAPFYGALEPAIDAIADGQSIIVEDFDYTEPDLIPAEEQSVENDVPDDLSLQQAPDHQYETGNDFPAVDQSASENNDLKIAERAANIVPDDQPMQMLHGGIIVAAGRIEGNGRIISLDNIVVTESGEQCRGDNLMQWNCGIHARTAFRSWLGSKTLSCRLPETDDFGIEVTTDCELASENAAQWLVRNGWVRAVAGGIYSDLGREAENAKRGIWGNKPVSLMPELAPLIEQPVQPPLLVPNGNNERPAGYFPPAPQN